METIFDIATPKELVEILGEDDTQNPYEFERALVQRDTDSNNQMLARLYSGRGDIKQAEKCLEKIQDKQLRQDVMISLHGCLTPQ